MPLVTHFTDDETWGKENGSRKVFVEKNLFFKKGEWALDITLKRIENKYWKWEISDFKQKNYGIAKFQAEWFTEEIKPGKINVIYTYALFPTNILLQPFLWLFTKTIWRMYMEHAMENIKDMAEHGEDFLNHIET